jgi:hypothetical protein
MDDVVPQDEIQEPDSIDLDDDSGDIPMAETIDIDGLDEEDETPSYNQPQHQPASMDSGSLF